MAKIKLTTDMGKGKAAKTDVSPQKGDRILSLFSQGVQISSEIEKLISSCNSSLNSRKATETDNAVKMSRAETEARKEDNRHSEEMAKIEQEWKKLSTAEKERDKKLSFIQKQIEKLQLEYDKVLSLEIEEFLSDAVTQRLESLHKVIVDLIKEFNRV